MASATAARRGTPCSTGWPSRTTSSRSTSPDSASPSPIRTGRAYTMDNACRIIGENLEEWGVSDPHVVGNSLGGAIALELGARGMARSVTALSPAGLLPQPRRPRPGARAAADAARRRNAARSRSSRRSPQRVRPPARRAVAVRRTRERFYNDRRARRRARAQAAHAAFERTFKAGFTYRSTSQVDVPTTIAWATRDLILRLRPVGPRAGAPARRAPRRAAALRPRSDDRRPRTRSSGSSRTPSPRPRSPKSKPRSEPRWGSPHELCE